MIIHDECWGMDESNKASKKIIKTHHDHIDEFHSIKSEKCYTIKNAYVTLLISHKGSTELSTLCTTKVRSTSLSKIYIGTLILNKWVQIEALYSARVWKNYTKFSEFCHLVKTPLNHYKIFIYNVVTFEVHE